MKNLKFSRLFAAVMFVACLVLVGCKQPDDGSAPSAVVLPENVRALTNEDGIIGKWTYDNKSWNAYGDYACNYEPNKIETASYGVQTCVVYIQEVSDTAGFIYYKFSDDMTGYGPGPEYAPYTVECAGKWCAVAYKNLTADSVQMCDAYKTYDFADSLSKAVELYTVENGWFAGIETTFTKVN